MSKSRETTLQWMEIPAYFKEFETTSAMMNIQERRRRKLKSIVRRILPKVSMRLPLELESARALCSLFGFV